MSLVKLRWITQAFLEVPCFPARPRRTLWMMPFDQRRRIRTPRDPCTNVVLPDNRNQKTCHNKDCMTSMYWDFSSYRHFLFYSWWLLLSWQDSVFISHVMQQNAKYLNDSLDDVIKWKHFPCDLRRYRAHYDVIVMNRDTSGYSNQPKQQKWK